MYISTYLKSFPVYDLIEINQFKMPNRLNSSDRRLQVTDEGSKIKCNGKLFISQFSLIKQRLLLIIMGYINTNRPYS